MQQSDDSDEALMDIDNNNNMGVGKGRIEVGLKEVISFVRNIGFEIVLDDQADRDLLAGT